MKFLFVFAHPDDESVACAGTMKRLADEGHQVHVVLATDGDAGEVSTTAQSKLAEHGSVGALRRSELTQVQQLLGIQNLTYLNFADGHITNEDVWGKLLVQITEVIDAYKPHVVITFDHSGWYFHLDHVGVSIATTLAVQKAEFPPELFFHAHFRVAKTKWKYVYSKAMPVTHKVDVSECLNVKLQTLEAHQSQNLEEPKRQIANDQPHCELYQLVSATEEGQTWLAEQNIFIPPVE